MSFFKNIFSGAQSPPGQPQQQQQQQQRPPRPHQPRTAPPARQFPPGLAAVNTGSNAPSGHSSAANSPVPPEADAAGGFDMFSGLSMGPEDASAPPPALGGAAAGLGGSGDVQGPTGASAFGFLAAADPEPASGSDDIFAGLGMSGPADPVVPSSGEVSAFGFVSDAPAGAAAAAAAGGAEPADAASGAEDSAPGAFGFLTADAGDEPGGQDAADPDSGFSFGGLSVQAYSSADGAAAAPSAFGFVADAPDEPRPAASKPGSSVSTPTPAQVSADTGFSLTSDAVPQLPPKRAAVAAPAPSSEPKEEDFDDTVFGHLALVEARFESACLEFWSSMAAVNRQKRERASQVAALGRALQEAERKLAAAESSQAAAIANDDFEKADSLNATVEDSKRRIGSIRGQLRGMASTAGGGGSAGSVPGARELSQAQEALVKVRELQHRLSSMDTDHSEELRKFVDSSSRRLRREAAELDTQGDRITRQIAMIDDDLGTVAAAESDVDAKVRALTEDVHDEKQTLEGSRDRAQGELDELLRQVEAKREELAHLDGEIAAKEAVIAQTRLKFASDYARLEGRREGMLRERSEAEGEQAEVNASRTALDAQRQRTKDDEVERAETLAAIQSQLSHVSLSAARLDELQSARELWQREEAQLRDDLSHLDAQLETADEEIEKTSDALSKLQADLEHHRANCSSVDARLPGLKNAKQRAVKSRDFKEAGRLSKEIKALSASREESIAAQERLDAEADRVDSKRQAQKADLDEHAANHKAIQTTLARKTFDWLCTQRQLFHAHLVLLDYSSADAALADSTTPGAQATQKAVAQQKKLLRDEVKELSEAAVLASEEYDWELPALIDPPPPPALVTASPTAASPGASGVVSGSDDDNELAREIVDAGGDAALDQGASRSASPAAAAFGSDDGDAASSAAPASSGKSATGDSDDVTPVASSSSVAITDATSDDDDVEEVSAVAGEDDAAAAAAAPGADAVDTLALEAERDELAAQIGELEESLEAAVEQDDFEQAEVLQGKIDTLSARKDQLEASLA